ncbi:MAG: hypothetical protein KF734_14650 [Saprospiraceae bacterium]|nr:hypothetical protein [Saprospiraceae bacterium]
MPAPIVPAAPPRLTATELFQRLKARGLHIERERFPFFVVGIRGYYKRTMGDPTQNDRGIYDDAIFLVSPTDFISYNANTDPKTVRKGRGKGSEKGMARLKAGIYFVHKFDRHNGRYEALCQRLGPVTVIRDGIDGDYEHTGNFGINIHRGALTETGSVGCQTIYPTQWNSFIRTAKMLAQRYYPDTWQEGPIPYILMEE